MATDNCITIPLTKGYETKVSFEDSDLASLKWCVTGNKRPYAYRSRKGGFLHRVIMSRVLQRELIKGEEVDHIDNDSLNNTRSNLRLATRSQNARNCSTRSDNQTGLKGVIPHRKRFWARITIHGKMIHLGTFNTPEEAHQAYCAASAKYHGEYGRTE